jgi:type III restriction enzyme
MEGYPDAPGRQTESDASADEPSDAAMTDQFFEHPILNSPHAYPGLHWELDAQGQPTNCIIDTRRCSDLITPVPKPRKQRSSREQTEMVLGLVSRIGRHDLDTPGTQERGERSQRLVSNETVAGSGITECMQSRRCFRAPSIVQAEGCMS